MMSRKQTILYSLSLIPSYVGLFILSWLLILRIDRVVPLRMFDLYLLIAGIIPCFISLWLFLAVRRKFKKP